MTSEPPGPKPLGAVWRPCRDLLPSHFDLKHEPARLEAKRWKKLLARLEDSSTGREAINLWLAEKKRDFAIETGQIEGLYLLKRGVGVNLITEGFNEVRDEHSVAAVPEGALKGLLQDQLEALEMLYAHVAEERPLTASCIREWHQLMTRHQETAAGIDPFGRRVEIPLRRGAWKIRPNNPRRQDGFVHEYCPPEQVESEIERFLAFHRGHANLDLAPELEAAWLHHEFVRIHPFQDGNGRVSRLLMALPFIKAGEFPPVIRAVEKDGYILALEAADAGRFESFVKYLGIEFARRMFGARAMAERALQGAPYRHANLGLTIDGVYHPPMEDDSHPSLI